MTWEGILISQENLLALKEMEQLKESPNDVISRLIQREKRSDSHPEEFEDYWKLEQYLQKIGGFVEMHKIRPDSDSVVARIGDLVLYYKLKDGKMQRCKSDECYIPEEMHGMVES